MSSIDRTPHTLKREKSLAMPRHIIFFDCETEQVELDNGNTEQRLILGWVCYYRKAYGRNLEFVEWLYFEDALSFWTFVYRHTEHKRKLWLISHNLNFDFTIVQGWYYLHQGGYKLRFFHNAGATTIISVRSKDGSLMFVDFMNWFAESLESIGVRLGIPKIKIDFETCTKAELNVYCKRDVEILLFAFKDFVRFLEGNHISRLCYTIASTAMAAYLFGCYSEKIYIHNNKEAIDLERESYKGGRVECFYIGELNDETYHVLDVNSLYPTVMASFAYPTAYKKMYHGMRLESLRTLLQTNSAIAKVMIETDEPAYAVKRGRTIFPTGSFWTVLTTPELFYALKHDHIVKIDDVVIYDQADLFSHYVNKLYQLRLDFKSAGVASYVEITKKLLNSLYGKFGQKGEVWEKIGDAIGEPSRVEICFSATGGCVKQIRYLLGEVWELTGYEETFNSFPAIASHVSAYARMYLYELMKIAGSGNYFYCDTDSLIVNDTGLGNLKCYLSETSLGSLKEIESTPTLVIRGLKDYATQTKTVIKGIRKNAVQLSDGVYEQERWPSLKGLLRQSSADTYTITTQQKILTREYTKGTVLDNGVVYPLQLCDPLEPAGLLF